MNKLYMEIYILKIVYEQFLRANIQIMPFDLFMNRKPGKAN